MSRKTKASPARIEVGERRARALELKRDGMTYRAVGAEMGISPQRAFELVNEGLAALPMPAAEELRKLELEKLDAIERDMRPKSKRGDTRAAKVLIQVGARRAKLLGLDMPVRINVAVAVVPTTRDYSRLTPAQLEVFQFLTALVTVIPGTEQKPAALPPGLTVDAIADEEPTDDPET